MPVAAARGCPGARGEELRFGTLERPAALDDMLRQPDQTRLVGQRVANRASRHEVRVALEGDPASRVVPVDRLQEADRTFLDEIVEG